MQEFSGMLVGFGPREESVFYLVLFLSVVFFVIAELVWALRKKSDPSVTSFLMKAPKDDVRLNVVWTVIPALVLILLCFANRHSGKNLPIRADGPDHAKHYVVSN